MLIQKDTITASKKLPSRSQSKYKNKTEETAVDNEKSCKECYEQELELP
jgi:hypothetical protein